MDLKKLNDEYLKLKGKLDNINNRIKKANEEIETIESNKKTKEGDIKILEGELEHAKRSKDEALVKSKSEEIKKVELEIKGFNEKGAQRFIKSMFNENIKLPQISRDIENQKSELSALKNYTANSNFKYNRIILSDNDKIIPTKNQIAFWEIEPNISSGHCPFMLFKKWEELL